MASGKISLRSYLTKQGVPDSMIKKLAEFRTTYDSVEDSRVRPPKVMFVDAYTDESGKVVSKGILRKSLGALLAGDNGLLTGPKGSGKNTLAETLAFLLKRPLYEVSMHVHADAETLIGKDTFRLVNTQREVVVGMDGDVPIKTTVNERQGEVQFNLAQFVEALKVGGIVVLDELNMARPEAAAVLNSALDDRGRIDIPGYGVIEKHPAARVIATMNPGYAGTQEINEALADRFVSVEVPPMLQAEIVVFFESRFPGIKTEFATQLAGLFRDMLDRAEKNELQPKGVTFRGLLQAVRLVGMGLMPHEAVSTCTVSRMYEQYDRQLVQTLVDSRIPKSWTAESVYVPEV